MKNVLVTGGLGFIGSNFINHIYHKYPSIEKVVNIDKVDYCSDHRNITITDKYEFIQFDIRYDDILEILEQYQIDVIFHFAAETHVDNSFKNSSLFLETNVMGTHHILQSIVRYGKLKMFFHVSTDEVYGDRKTFTEEDYLEPTNPYAASKASAEMFVRSYSHSYGLQYRMIRMNNVYGPNQYRDKLIPRAIEYFLSNKKMTIQGSGNVFRTFIHVQDAINAICKIYDDGEKNKTYNIGSNNRYSILDVVKKIHTLLFNNERTFEDDIEFVEDRPYNDSCYDVDCTILQNMGWKESIMFDEGIQETIDYIKNRFII